MLNEVMEPVAKSGAGLNIIILEVDVADLGERKLGGRFAEECVDVRGCEQSRCRTGADVEHVVRVGGNRHQSLEEQAKKHELKSVVPIGEVQNGVRFGLP